MLARLATVVALTAAPALGFATAAHASEPTDVPRAAKVLLIAVPDLRWADMPLMPTVQKFAAHAAVAELSVKTASGAPRCAAGSVTLSAGNRANAVGIRNCYVSATNLHRIRDVAIRSKFDAHVGALGSALADAGLTAAAAGDKAIPIVADENGDVPVRTVGVSAALARADVVATVLDAIYREPGQLRAYGARVVDERLTNILADVPPQTTVIVAGTSDGAYTHMHLHALFIAGPGWRHETLRSPSTVPPYVQLRDLAPTILGILGLPTPDTMVGRPVSMTGHAPASAASYADDDDHAVTARDVGQRLRTILTEIGLGVLLFVVVGRWRPQAGTVARWVAAACVGLPIASYLVQLLPWWRWGTWAFAGIIAAISLAFGGVIWRLRDRPAAAVAVVPALTAVTLVVDQLLGAPLDLSAPTGDNPIVAGRYHGMGNVAFALMCGGTLITTALLAAELRRRGRPRLASACAVGLVLVAIVVDAAPPLGDDYGGVLTMGPVAVVFLALVLGIRLTWRRLVLAIAAVVALAVGVALLDYSRPASHQTHVGRFVGQVLHGGAWQVVSRKLDASLGSFGNVAVTGFFIVTLALVVAARTAVRSAARRVPGLGAAVVALVLLAVLGTFLNDSGVTVGAEVFLLGVLAVVGGGVVRPDP